MKIEFTADKIKLRGPRIDGSMIVDLEVGEYEREKLKDLLDINSEQVIRVTLEPLDTD